jgi:nucleoside-diphosphate-sugar epimerase
MSVLITGGTGFIGSRLAYACRDSGQAVKVLGQENTPAERANACWLTEKGVELILGSVGEEGVVRDAMAGVDTVYHLAAAQHEANVPDSHFREVNVEGTRRVLDAASAAGVRRVVHGSTIGVYGALEGTIDENSPCRPDNVYGITKLEGERVVRSFNGRLEAVIVRISETYGPGDRRLLKLFRAIKGGRFFRIGNGRNLHHLIYVDDLIDGMRRASESDRAAGHTFVISGREPVTTDAMMDAIARALDVAPPRLRFPLWPFMAAAVVMEAVLRPAGIQPPLHRRRMDFFRKGFVFDQTRCREALGFEPATGFVEGARRTARWYEDQKLL